MDVKLIDPSSVTNFKDSKITLDSLRNIARECRKYDEEIERPVREWLQEKLGENYSDEFDNLEDFLKHADGPSMNASRREGLVYKACSSINGEVPSFKVISNKWLLKVEE